MDFRCLLILLMRYWIYIRFLQTLKMYLDDPFVDHLYDLFWYLNFHLKFYCSKTKIFFSYQKERKDIFEAYQFFLGHTNALFLKRYLFSVNSSVGLDFDVVINSGAFSKAKLHMLLLGQLGIRWKLGLKRRKKTRLIYDIYYV